MRACRRRLAAGGFRRRDAFETSSGRAPSTSPRWSVAAALDGRCPASCSRGACSPAAIRRRDRRLADGPGLRLRVQRVRGLSVLGRSDCTTGSRLSLGPALTWAAGLAAQRSARRRCGFPAFDRRDVVAAALALLIVPVVTWAPYRSRPRAGRRRRRLPRVLHGRFHLGDDGDVGDRQGTRAAARTRSSNGEPLHYYWMAHFLSGALYRNVSGLGHDGRAGDSDRRSGVRAGVRRLSLRLVRLAGPGPPFCAARGGGRVSRQQLRRHRHGCGSATTAACRWPS